MNKIQTKDNIFFLIQFIFFKLFLFTQKTLIRAIKTVQRLFTESIKRTFKNYIETASCTLTWKANVNIHSFHYFNINYIKVLNSLVTTRLLH